MNPNLSRSEIMRKYGVKSYSSLYSWISKYSDVILAEEYNLSFMVNTSNKDSSVQKMATSEEKIKQLEKQLEEERLKVLLYQRMIEIAEDEFKIPIRKKFGPQQSVVSKQNKK
jgi:transposase-like protein